MCINYSLSTYYKDENMKTLLILLLCMSFSIITQASLIIGGSEVKGYNLKYQIFQETVTITLTTKQIYSSMCTREVTNLLVTYPKEYQNFRGNLPHISKGIIDITSRYNPRTFCLMASGPHKVRLTLDRGDFLPDLRNGIYIILLDKELVDGRLRIGTPINSRPSLPPNRIPRRGNEYGNGEKIQDLMDAADFGQDALVDVLLQYGDLSVDARDELYGDTALIKAVRSGHYQVVDLLLRKYQASLYAQNNYGETPVSVAQNNQQMADFLNQWASHLNY